ncbi:isopeptide-forming domain-containing fimbrial protein [Enterococcus mundtii]|uniref:isopeptide-forming domain-containing fimbrial protein n=1 Tax=Enterococcus mundtii TaxID=53346 RepID=UPI001CD03C4B|nr:isopeptide-forming domain-containing fimbrial protein [Enterococcus mundtii]UBM05680.1 isopeptide-forming domain-containing fimbrial protein [Enterococcus mundtii]
MTKYYWFLLLLPFLLVGGAKTCIAQTQEMVQLIVHTMQPSSDKQTESHKASFAVYDVTKSFYQLRKKGFTVEETQQIIARQGTSAGSFLMEKLVKSNNDGEDVAIFDLRESTNQIGNVYLVNETTHIADAFVGSQNVVVVLPLYDSYDHPQKAIHLYPKMNQEPSAIVFEKKLVEEKNTYSIGEKIYYQLDIQFPNGIATEETCVVTDSATKELELLTESLKVHSEEKRLENLTFHSHSQGFSIAFNGQDLQDLAGKTVRINYQMRLRQDAIADQSIINQATLDIGTASLSRSTRIRTGGKWFQKVTKDKEQQVLEDAMFMIKNQQEEYLHLKDGKYCWKKRARDAITLTSDRNGLFSINGLADGEYLLEEIKAPKGYKRNPYAVSFVVKSMSYAINGQPSEPLKITNQKQETSFLFPKTTDEKISVGMIGGISIIGSFIIYQKNRSKEE